MIILADPPWSYSFSQSDSRQIENKYPTMSIEEICALRFMTYDNSLLLMWATAPKLLEALRVIREWGYEYKTHCIWDKQMIGMGYWFRGQHELLLVGTRGHFSPPDQQDRTSSLFSEKRTKHSKKPECIYQWIEQCWPDEEKLELFARKPRSGWKVWGNEVECDIKEEPLLNDGRKINLRGI